MSKEYFLTKIKNAEKALEDLNHVKDNKHFNEYVTAKNIDEWITGQLIELKKFKEMYRVWLWEQIQIGYRFTPEVRDELKSEYAKCLKNTKKITFF